MLLITWNWASSSLNHNYCLRSRYPPALPHLRSRLLGFNYIPSTLDVRPAGIGGQVGRQAEEMTQRGRKEPTTTAAVDAAQRLCCKIWLPSGGTLRKSSSWYISGDRPLYPAIKRSSSAARCTWRSGEKATTRDYGLRIVGRGWSKES